MTLDSVTLYRAAQGHGPSMLAVRLDEDQQIANRHLMNEYCECLEWLQDNHPDVYDEWMEVKDAETA